VRASTAVDLRLASDPCTKTMPRANPTTGFAAVVRAERRSNEVRC
jgi:hypothetical protein